MPETNIAGLILLDSGGTLNRMTLEEMKKLLALAARANCHVIIATGAESISEDQTPGYLSKMGLPIEEWPDIQLRVKKDDLQTYHTFARDYGILIDRVILIDDAAGNAACATISGAVGLKFFKSDNPTCRQFAGERNETRDFSLFGFKFISEEFEKPRPFFEVLENTLSRLAPTQPQAAGGASPGTPPAVT